ncbi:hypothetical protein [Kordiimonas sp.]|uniref:hypothetical protein n=1 Tax=Kordiimonas sp. TaxID=1970157 RepID=UPI003A933D88
MKHRNHGASGRSIDMQGEDPERPLPVVLELAEIFKCICESSRSPTDADYEAVAKAVLRAERESPLPPHEAIAETVKTLREMYRSAESDCRVFDHLRQQSEAGIVRTLKHRQIILTIAARMHPDLHRELCGTVGVDDWREVSTAHLGLESIDGVSMRLANQLRQRFPKVGMLESHRIKFGLRTIQGVGEVTALKIERKMQECIAAWCEDYQFVSFDYMDMAQMLLAGEAGHGNSWSGLPPADEAK